MRPIKILTYNIQTGISVHRYIHYLTKSWQFFLPTTKRTSNLNKISELIQEYDIVALQEVDIGSLRSHFINQVEYLAIKGGFPYWHAQCTRKFWIFAQQGNGLLSKFPIHEINDHKLPGLIPGRGLLCCALGKGDEKLLLVVLHLSLGTPAQQQQISYLERLIKGHRHVVIMGDMNCLSESRLFRQLIDQSHFYSAGQGLKTFPSWSPMRDIDHILVSPSLRVKEVHLAKKLCSDHLPLGVSLRLPVEIGLMAQASYSQGV